MWPIVVRQYAGSIAILIAITSSWNFPHSLRFPLLARYPKKSCRHSGSFFPSLIKNTYGMTSILPNQNASICMVPLLVKTPETHQHITTSIVIYVHDPKNYWIKLQSQVHQCSSHDLTTHCHQTIHCYTWT